MDAIGALPFTGNLIPHAWYTALTLPSGQPDLVAIALLADIVSWYRPVVERDPATGQVLSQRKKFKGDMLQRSSQAFADQFGFTKHQVMEARYRLEKTYGVIRKVLRHLDTPSGRCANVLADVAVHQGRAQLVVPPGRRHLVPRQVTLTGRASGLCPLAVEGTSMSPHRGLFARLLHAILAGRRPRPADPGGVNGHHPTSP